MLGMITKSNPGGDGTPAETKAIFSKFIFIETRKECWNIDKITSKGFTTGQNKQKKYKYKLIGGLTRHSGVSVLLQAERSDSYSIASLLT